MSATDTCAVYEDTLTTTYNDVACNCVNGATRTEGKCLYFESNQYIKYFLLLKKALLASEECHINAWIWVLDYNILNGND